MIFDFLFFFPHFLSNQTVHLCCLLFQLVLVGVKLMINGKFSDKGPWGMSQKHSSHMNHVGYILLRGKPISFKLCFGFNGISMGNIWLQKKSAPSVKNMASRQAEMVPFNFQGMTKRALNLYIHFLVCIIITSYLSDVFKVLTWIPKRVKTLKPG